MKTLSSKYPRVPILPLLAGIASLQCALLLRAEQLPDPVVTASSTPYSGAYAAQNMFGPDSPGILEFATRGLGPVSTPLTTDVNNGTWVELDFGSTVSFNQFVMRSRPNAADIVAESRLIVSADPTFEASDTVLTFNPSGNNGAGLLQSFPTVTGRYVRWEVTQGTAGGNLGAAQMFFLRSPEGTSLLPAPAVVNYAAPFNDTYAAAYAVNGDAGNGGGGGHEFASANWGVGMFADFDFGASKPISGFDYWNRPVDVVTAFDLIFADNPDFTSPIATKSFTASTNGNQVASGTFPPVTARYVRLQATANEGGDNTGIVEIQFHTPGLKAPEFTTQPQGGTRFVGLQFTFSVQAAGALPLAYQWTKGGTPIAGATNTTLTLTGLTAADAGDYRVIVTNSVGSVTSDVATLVVADPPVDTTGDLVLHLKFDETQGTTAADASAQKNNATLTGFSATKPIWVEGRIGNALEFNQDGEATDDDLVLTDAAINFPKPDVYTFSFWAKPYGLGQLYNPRVISPFGITHWILWKPAAGVGMWPNIPTTAEPTLDVWHHFAVTYDRAGSRYSVYVDGTLRADNVNAERPDPGPVQWAIGHPENPVTYIGDSWRGALDDIRIYNRILSPKDIKAIYAEGGVEPVEIAGQPAGGIAYPGERFTFTVRAGGTPPLTYQWKKDGQNLANATNETLTLTGLTTADTGDYSVAVANAETSATSAVARLSVIDPAIDLASGLVMHLKLDETSGTVAADASGKGNAGDLLNFADPGANWVKGILGNALEFNSAATADNQAVAVPSSPTLEFADAKVFSFAFWAKGPTQANSAGLLCKGLGGGGEAWCLDMWNAGYRFFVRNGTDGGATPAQTMAAPDGTWQLISASLDLTQGRMRVYVNGVEAASATPPTTLMANAEPVDIGCRQFQGGYTLPFVGIMDDVRLYNRVLSPKEHKALYTQGVPDVTLKISQTPAGIVIQWPAEVTGFALESSATLPGTTWNPVAGVANNSVTITPTGDAAYYRLRKSQ